MENFLDCLVVGDSFGLDEHGVALIGFPEKEREYYRSALTCSLVSPTVTVDHKGKS